MSVRRRVAWPRDVAAVARSLAREAASAGADAATAVSGGAWYWLDGEAPEPDGSRGCSRLGVARETRVAARGAERAFLDGLRGAADDAWVVALSYEFGVALMGLEPENDEVSPGFALRRGVELVLDHDSGRCELIADDDAIADAWLARHGAALERAAFTGVVPELVAPAARSVQAAWRRAATEYESQVDDCRAAIRDGEAYVLCLTDTADVAGEFDPLETYLRLRSGAGGSAPAVRGGVMVAGGRALVSASPERFVSVSDRRVRTHPIKGTRPRGRNAGEDAALAAELAADPKERAENLMIVDLMRNDLSRVCVPGTVAAEGFLRVETHPRVHQLVSTVSGTILPGLDALDIVAACLPGGSMTGAPKHRAVEILAGLERAPRGLYSGCFGWIDGNGAAELAMSIRCIELRGIGTASARALVGAGGGVTIDSDPERERAEKDLKAVPMLEALGARPDAR